MSSAPPAWRSTCAPILTLSAVACDLLSVPHHSFQRSVLLMMLQQIARVTVGAEGSPAANGASQPGGTLAGSSSTSSLGDASPKRELALRIELSHDGEKGWELLSSGMFDIALISVNQLSGVSGLDLSWCYQDQLAQSVRKLADEPPGGGGRQTIIIACTMDEQVTSEKAAQYGIHDVLKKPVSTQALRHMLHKWMPRDYSPPTLLRSPVADRGGGSSNAAEGNFTGGAGGNFTGRILMVDDCEVCDVPLHLPRSPLLSHDLVARPG